MNEKNRRGIYTRIIAWSTLVGSLFVLFYDNLGGINLTVDTYLKGTILLGAGMMMLFETIFDRDMDFEDPYSINFLVGVPSGVIAVALGISYLTKTNAIVQIFGGFEGGIYLAGIIILAYEGITAAAKKNINLRELRGD